MNPLDSSTITFLDNVIKFTEATEGKEGLKKLLTVKGQKEMMSRYIESNMKTIEKYLNAESDVKLKINNAIMTVVYNRMNKKDDNRPDQEKS